MYGPPSGIDGPPAQIQKEVPEDLAMASGWAPDGAVQAQIDDSVSDEVARARALMPKGEAALYCVECGEEMATPDRGSRSMANWVPRQKQALITEGGAARAGRRVSTAPKQQLAK